MIRFSWPEKSQKNDKGAHRFCQEKMKKQIIIFEPAGHHRVFRPDPGLKNRFKTA